MTQFCRGFKVLIWQCTLNHVIFLSKNLSDNAVVNTQKCMYKNSLLMNYGCTGIWLSLLYSDFFIHRWQVEILFPVWFSAAYYFEWYKRCAYEYWLWWDNFYTEEIRLLFHKIYDIHFSLSKVSSVCTKQKCSPSVASSVHCLPMVSIIIQGNREEDWRIQ